MKYRPIMIIVLLVIFLIAGCSGIATPSYSTSIPWPTPEPLPTYTPYPTPDIADILTSDHAVNVSLISLSYVAGRWNPALIDLRTAETDGILVNNGYSLRFYDIWVTVPDNALGYHTQAEVYANGEFIGATPKEPLTPGTMQLGEIDIKAYRHADVDNAWEKQEEWKVLEVVLNIYAGETIVSGQTTTIRLDGSGKARLKAPPYANLASVVYSINDGPDFVMDLRKAVDEGIQVFVGDLLTIKEIWYRSDDDEKTIMVEAYLSSGEYESSTLLQSDAMVVKSGTHQFTFDEPMSWEIPDGKEKLVISLLGKDGTLLDRLITPFESDGVTGLTQASQQVIPSGIALIGMSYEAFGWNPKMVDLRNVSTEGILMWPNNPLKFFDLIISVPENVPAYTIRAEVYLDDQLIGITEDKQLETGNLVLEKITVLDHFYKDFTDIWEVGEWEGLDVRLVVTDKNTIIGSLNTFIRFNDAETSWLISPPYAQFVSIVYSVNNGPEKTLDFRTAVTDGFDVKNGDTLAIREIWYKSNSQMEDCSLRVNGSHKYSDTVENFVVSSSTADCISGIRQMLTEPIIREITNETTMITLYLGRDDGAILDILDIPVGGN